jgi:hypothetical protein
VIVRRKLLGDDRFDTALKIAEDRDLLVRLVGRTSIYIQSEPTAQMTERPGSLSRSDVDLDCRSMLCMVRKHADVLGSAGLRKWEASVYRRWAATHLGLGCPEKAIRPALWRLVYQPISAEGWWVFLKSLVYAVRGVKKALPEVEAAHAAV